MSESLPRGAAATLACLYEATAAKPGNVHPRAAFNDAEYSHFVASGVVIGPILDRAQSLGVGPTVLEAVRATREVAGTNTNLGTLLLLSPLAAVPLNEQLVPGIRGVLKQLSHVDARHVYEAIRLAGAGGLGHAEKADVFADVPPELTLVDTMRLAADRDLIARQYTNGFADVFRVAHWIAEGAAQGWRLSDAIIHAHVQQMAAWPDSLIQRKCGPQTAQSASQRAAAVLAAGAPGQPGYGQTLGELDTWLRADGHHRNPGTTADLIAAGLFVLLRDGRLDWQAW